MKTIATLLIGLAASVGMSQGTPLIHWYQGGHQATVSDIVCSPNGLLLASTGGHSLRLWRTNDHGLQKRMLYPKANLYGAAFTPDSAVVAAGAFDGRIRLHRVADGNLLYELNGYDLGGVKSIAFHRSSTGVLSLYSAHTNRVAKWVLGTSGWSRQWTWDGISYLRNISISPSGRYLAVSSAPNTLVFDTVGLTSSPTWSLNHGNYLDGVRFSPNGAYLASHSRYGVKVWNTSGWSLSRAVADVDARALAFTSDSQTFFVGGVPRILTQWNLDGTKLYQGPVNSATIDAIASVNSGLAYHNGYPNGIIAERATGARMLFPGHGTEITGLSTSATGLIATSGEDHTWKTWDEATGRITHSFATPSLHEAWQVAVTSDGLKAVVFDDGNTTLGRINVYNIATGAKLNAAPIYQTYLTSAMEMSPIPLGGNGYVCAIANGPQVGLLRVSDCTFIRTLPDHSGTVKAIAFSKDGSRMVTAGLDNAIVVYRTSDWAVVGRADAGSDIKSVAFNPGGAEFAVCTSTYNAKVQVYRRAIVGNQEGWPEVKRFVPTDGIAERVSYSADGSTLWIASAEKIHIYRTGSWALLRTFDGETKGIVVMRPGRDNGSMVYATNEGMLFKIGNPYPTLLRTVSASPGTVQAGTASTLTISLTSPAPPGGITVSLEDTSAGVGTPASVVFAAGQISRAVSVPVSSSCPAGPVSITAKLLGGSSRITLTITR